MRKWLCPVKFVFLLQIIDRYVEGSGGYICVGIVESTRRHFKWVRWGCRNVRKIALCSANVVGIFCMTEKYMKKFVWRQSVSWGYENVESMYTTLWVKNKDLMQKKYVLCVCLCCRWKNRETVPFPEDRLWQAEEEEERKIRVRGQEAQKAFSSGNWADFQSLMHTVSPPVQL